ncbi:MAG: hypothetical protein JJ896_15505 [Rhodothermales bacterium]|nr:hypothetical protein [Rhodothermales bacterium]MBO6781061.1 hypothetical protein [Rhodothermales bacterium]
MTRLLILLAAITTAEASGQALKADKLHFQPLHDYYRAKIDAQVLQRIAHPSTCPAPVDPEFTRIPEAASAPMKIYVPPPVRAKMAPVGCPPLSRDATRSRPTPRRDSDPG